MLKNQHADFLVYEIGNKIAGYIITLQHKKAKLSRHYSLAVLPKFRGNKIAEKLLIAAEEETDKAGFKLEIKTDNNTAMKLYKKLGYKVKREIISYYQDGSNAYEMVKII